MSGYLLIINVGSTSIKSCLFSKQLDTTAQLAADYGSGLSLSIEGYGLDRQSITRCIDSRHDTSAALAVILALWRQLLSDSGVQLVAIGHRVVHGATWFDKPTRIDAEMLAQLEQLDAYAPLHNPFNRLGIQMAAEFFPESPQFALFDTAFHRTLPDYAARYAIPEQLSTEVAFWRYGFHGLSCQHSVLAAAELLQRTPSELNLIILHLGGGASATAVRGGMSVDTSMGFSPTEGLIMAGRCGDVDPMIVLTLQREGMSVQQLDNTLNRLSGLRALCGEGDMRAIVCRAEQGDDTALLALEMFCYRIKKYIGAYCAVLGSVDALVFTGGIGEHAPLVRQKIVAGLENLGFALDNSANQQHNGENTDISVVTSQSRILVVHAEEEKICARQILTILDSTSAHYS